MIIECHASYLRDAFEDTDMVIERVAKALEGKDYDTIVGSGVSGAILLLKLRDRFKCNVAVVRKANDGSHSAEHVEGTIGERFVVVDDQVASGGTVKHILRQIRKQLHDREGVYNMPKFVGVACYCYSGPFCGIEQWIDASDDRFLLPELPIEKPRAAPRSHAVLSPSNAQRWTQCPGSYTQPEPMDNTLATVATVLAVEAIVESVAQTFDSGVCTPDTPIDFGS